MLARLAAAPIRFYRRFLSPLKPPMCRFSPTCSEYAIVALETHGLVRGSLLAVWRILRCNPLCEGGHDPVPGSESRAAPDAAVDERPPARQDPPS